MKSKAPAFMACTASLGIRPQSVEALEKFEANGSIKLDTLRRAAEALDCTLVYALVPNTSLEAMVCDRDSHDQSSA
ncbi:hypothetical protein SAMN04488498_106230 [Mesorhizobium albiziae]|uniref:Uncharacterized protein n=1 Tax=Neomesorhizobium albiziae TaxID=335020 RepID=A0A1I3ZP61_9HYPH|nr:hypothetical protein GCM10007937_39950 [Mesorhizobium albiziae]SFK45787.1 hypothetical protein SAMN04488498_106230 [Mesorhizobium albiziae]